MKTKLRKAVWEEGAWEEAMRSCRMNVINVTQLFLIDALSYSRKYSCYMEHCIKISCISKQYKGQDIEKSENNL